MPIAMPMGGPAPAPETDDVFGKVMKDPWFRLGMALLKEGGPQDRPHSVGQDIARAVDTVQGQMDDDLVRDDQRRKMDFQRQMQGPALEMMQGAMSPSGMSPGGMPVGAPPTTSPQAAFMPPPVASRIDPVANPSSDIRLTSTRPSPSRLRSSSIDERITRAARNAGVDPLLFRSLVQSESNFEHLDPRKGGITRSPAGALGVAQLMPGTAGELGVDPMDLDQNLAGGARYLAQQIKASNGNVREALRAYNAGPTGARRNPGLGGGYADTIMGRLPTGVNAAAPSDAPPPAMPAPPATPTAVPPDLNKMFMWQAYATSGGDSSKFIGEYNRLVLGWQMEQSKANRSSSDAMSKAFYEDQLARKREEEKFNRETQAAAGTKYDTAQAEKDFERFSKLQEGAPTIETNLSTIQDMKSLLKGGLNTGAGADVVQNWASLVSMFTGAKLDVGKGDYFSALSVQTMKNLRAQYAAMGVKDPNPAVYDSQMDEKMSPSLKNSPEGNMLILMQMERKSRQALEVAQAASDFAAADPNNRFSGLMFERSPAYKAIADKYRMKPSDFDRSLQVARLLVSGTPEISTEEEFKALPSGAVFITPDYRIKRKP